VNADETIALRDLELCFEGAVPAVIATAAADGTPNVTYLSCIRVVDDTRVALSNQFFSKTARNLAANPRGSLLVIDPVTYEQFRLTVVYERTERRGQVFDRLRTDVDAVAAMQGMEEIFKLRAADLYRVVRIDRVLGGRDLEGASPRRELPERTPPGADRLAEVTARLSRCTDLDAIVGTTVDAVAEVLGYQYSSLLLLDEAGTRLYTIASHGYRAEGVGSEVVVGEGIVGMAAARATPIRVGNLRQMAKYSKTVRRSYETHDAIEPGRDIPVPGLPQAQSRVAVPALSLGQLVGVLVVESLEPVAFTVDDEATLAVVASVVANAVEAERARESVDDGGSPDTRRREVASDAAAPVTHVRFFAVDGSTFLDGDYLIKGVAGRVLWSLLGHYTREGRDTFTNREVRLDPALELPDFRDNLDSRLILLKRRLDERDAPIRIERTGRGRFRLVVETALRLDMGGT
jgi:GAF domain/Pyridoxamine 5'-phosphate oxidase